MKPAVSDTEVILLVPSSMIATMIKSPAWHGPRIRLKVNDEELALAKQSNPFTKLAVMIPAALMIAVVGLAEAEGEKVIEVELDVQDVKT